MLFAHCSELWVEYIEDKEQKPRATASLISVRIRENTIIEVVFFQIYDVLRSFEAKNRLKTHGLSEQRRREPSVLN